MRPSPFNSAPAGWPPFKCAQYIWTPSSRARFRPLMPVRASQEPDSKSNVAFQDDWVVATTGELPCQSKANKGCEQLLCSNHIHSCEHCSKGAQSCPVHASREAHDCAGDMPGRKGSSCEGGECPGCKQRRQCTHQPQLRARPPACPPASARTYELALLAERAVQVVGHVLHPVRG